MLLESIGGVTPFRCGRFADRVLLAEEASLVESFVEWNSVEPADFDEVFGVFGVIGIFSMIVGFAEDFEAGLKAVCSFDFKVLGGGCRCFDFADPDITEFWDAHPNQIAGGEH